MVGFFLSWVFGPSFDIKIQKSAYVKDPDRGVITPTGLTFLIVVSLSAAWMLWATQDEKTFFVALTGFIILNISGYIFIHFRMRSIVRSSERQLKKNKSFVRLAKLHFVKEFMFGSWQKYRFLFMLLSIVLLNALCFATPFRNAVSELIQPFLSIEKTTISPLLPDLGLMCFLVASEGWIWAQRLKVSVALETINSLSRSYRLSLLSDD